VVSVDRHADDTGDDGASLVCHRSSSARHLLLMNMPERAGLLRIGEPSRRRTRRYPVGPYEATTTGLTVSFSRWSRWREQRGLDEAVVALVAEVIYNAASQRSGQKPSLS
jgi:hypothetical protein